MPVTAYRVGAFAFISGISSCQMRMIDIYILLLNLNVACIAVNYVISRNSSLLWVEILSAQITKFIKSVM